MKLIVFSPYPEETRFTIRAHHWALQGILTINDATRELVRGRLRLSELKFQIIHCTEISTKQLTHCCFSRLKVRTKLAQTIKLQRLRYFKNVLQVRQQRRLPTFSSALSLRGNIFFSNGRLRDGSHHGYWKRGNTDTNRTYLCTVYRC